MGYLVYILEPIYKILESFIELLLRHRSAIFAIFGVILGCANEWCACERWNTFSGLCITPPSTNIRPSWQKSNPGTQGAILPWNIGLGILKVFH